MTDDKRQRKSRVSESSVQKLQLEDGHTKREPDELRTHEIKQESASSNSQSPSDTSMKSASQSPVKQEIASHSPFPGNEKHEEIIGGEITVKLEPGQPPKLSRSTSQKIVARPPPLFDDYEDKTKESRGGFEVIPECSYSSKYIGSSEHDSMDCDCAEEWDSYAKTNAACGPDSDCINRATKMECVGDCGCGADCQNQRFQKQQFADVTVIQTEKKGYGLRTNTDLSPDEMIYEYIGEVIDENRFRRRTAQYHEDGIKHFYFMSLSKGEFIDATKKGNLVGEKLRMGIFAERKIQKGEELVFNYNVDRYGADPQPCYCGEPNCTGFLGGKTQTERGTKLSNTTIEALGIDDGDGWDTAVAKKPRKKKTGENDEEYVNNVQPKSLDESGVTKVMATLMQCKEKWIAVKLLGRIQRCDDERVRNRVVKMHGYQILNSTLALWKEDPNVVLQVFDILDKFPRLTRNKISDSKIESTVESLLNSGDDRVESQAASLLKEWSTLEVAYRIPRKKRETVTASTTATPDKSDRFGRRGSREERKARSKSRSRSRSKSIDAPRGPAAPSGPRSNFPQRNPDFYAGPRPPFRPRPFNSLPPGWFPATDENGRTYYYDASGKTTWQRPTMAAAPPPPPPKPTSTNKALEDIINEITSAKANTPKEKPLPSSTTLAVNGNVKKESKGGPEKWRTYSEEKQRKLYENTASRCRTSQFHAQANKNKLFPHIKYVMEKFKGKLSKDDLKRFAKEISKKLVSSDYKNHRVEDPTKISSRQEKQVKKYVQDYFEKAVTKKKEHDRKKAERKVKVEDGGLPKASATTPDVKKEDDSDEGQDMAMSEDEDDKPKQESATPVTPMDQLLIAEGLKRKRGIEDNPNGVQKEDEDATPTKRLKSESPPPPPPPPPVNELQLDTSGYSSGHSDNGGSPQILTGSHDSPMTNDISTGDALGYANHPPPPPPPKAPENLDATDAANVSIDDDAGIAGNAHAHDRNGTPNIEMEYDETINEHERHYPAHGHRPKLSVQGGT